jgi:hypothetical protein
MNTPAPSPLSAIDHLKPLFDAQREHPCVPKLELAARAGTGELAYRLALPGEKWTMADAAAIMGELEGRDEVITQMTTRPLWYAREPDIWREMDLRMARKRLQYPGVVLELLVLGGIRSGKTFGSIRRLLCNFLYTHKAWVWSYSDTEKMSQTIQQARTFDLLPPEMRTDTGKHKSSLKMRFKYKEGSGFTANSFNIHWKCRDERNKEIDGGGLFDYRFYHSANSAAEGAELTGAGCDELVGMDTVDTVRQRLLTRAAETRAPEYLERIREAIRRMEHGEFVPPPLLGAIYHGVNIITFTPKEGYSPVVGDFLDGAVTLLEVRAACPENALPHTANYAPAREVWSEAEKRMVSVGLTPEQRAELLRDLLPGRMVPRLKQPKKDTRLVGYIHTYDNPIGGNWAGMVADCKDKPISYIRTIAFGDVDKEWRVQFKPPFNDLHHVIHDRALIPRVGTFRLIIDPHKARPWFMCFHLTDALKRRYVVREWPQEGSYVPDHGDPGAWAVTSRTGKINGDLGPAQEMQLGWGFDEYTREILRVCMEIGTWFYTPEEQAARRVVIEWDKYPDFRLEGSPVPLFDFWMDPRFSNTPLQQAAGEQNVIVGMLQARDAYEISGPGAHLFKKPEAEAGSGKDIASGDSLIITALGGYNASAFVPESFNVMNCPNLRFWHECHAHIFSMQNFSYAAFKEKNTAQDEACKDPRDCLSMVEQKDPYHREINRHHGSEDAGGW